MTNAQLEGLVRALMAILAGYALKYGIDGATWMAITAGVSSAAIGIWSWYSNSIDKQIKDVAESKEVIAVVTQTQKLADSIPSEKVVSRHDTIADIGKSSPSS